jgi:hypothetical protein
MQAYRQYGVGSRPLCNLQKGALDSQVIKLTSCLPMVGGCLQVFRLLPPPPTKTGRHDIAGILLKVALKHQKSKIKIKINKTDSHDITEILLKVAFNTMS